MPRKKESSDALTQVKKHPRVTKALIEKYLKLEEERKSLSRQSKDLKVEQDVIHEAMEQFVRDNGGKGKTVSHAGFVLAIITKNGSVSWKDEFVKKCGSEIAEELIAAAPKKEELTVEKAA